MKRSLLLLAALTLSGCAMPQMSPEDRYRLQQNLDRQRADQQAQTDLMMRTIVSRPPTPAPQAVQQQGVTAIWTGKSQTAQSVTGIPGFQCEYNYAGRTFWRMFAGPCPTSVQVQ